jgi:hypothetical protein
LQYYARCRKRLWGPIVFAWICGTGSRLEGQACGIPHLAKNERDMGHPAIVAGIELKALSQGLRF